MSYTKITHNNDGQKLVDNIHNMMQNDINVIVYNFVDMLSHARTEMEVLKELAGDETSYRSITRSWFEHSPLHQALKKIADKKDKAAVEELISLLQHKDRNIQSDAIKVLYETGEKVPSLIKAYAKNFLRLLDDKNKRNIWGAMTALDSIALDDPQTIYANLPKIMAGADKGSVIAKDHAVSILIKLCGLKKYSENCFVLLIEILQSCATNQLPMYAENAIGIIDDSNKTTFSKKVRHIF